jgi:ATP-dependent DNA helicase RecG
LNARATKRDKRPDRQRSSLALTKTKENKMSRINLTELSARESERVEWKENVADVEDVVKTISAFSNDYANMGGGYVVCGAKEEKDAHGFQTVKLVGLTSDRLKELEGRVLAQCRQNIDPAVVPIVEELETPDPSKRVLVFIVPATRHAHSYRASKEGSPTYYARLGRETVMARNGVFRELMVRKGAFEPWGTIELLPTRPWMISIFWRSENIFSAWGFGVPRTLWVIFLSDVNSISAFVPPLLCREKITQVLRPRNYAALLFGKNPMKVAPGAYLIISFYPGVNRSETTAQRHELTGSIIAQAEKAMDILLLETSTYFDKESPRPNLVKYPKRALQEAVINAIAHRDYESSQPARITVFRDRIEILSPGSLPSAIPQDKFVEGKASPYWRNQTLAYFFSKLQLAQAEGQGIPTIIRTMRGEGCPDPRFELEPERVITILPANPRTLSRANP